MLKFFNKDDLDNSRIFFDKNPPNFILYFIMFIIIFLVSISFNVKRLYIVKAPGSITTIDNQFISSNTTGQVVAIYKKEGDYVKKGDMLFKMSSGVNGAQVDILSSKKLEFKKQMDAIDLFVKSLKENKNYLKNSGYEQEYYNKLEYYFKVNNSSNSQLNFLKNEKNILVEKLDELNADIIRLESELKKLEENKDVENDKELEENKDVENDRELEEYNKEVEENKSKIDAKKYEIENKKVEIDNLKSTIRQYEAQLSYNTEEVNLKSQFTSEALAKKTTLKNQLIDLEDQLELFATEDSLYEIKAENDGIVHYLVSMKEGLAFQTGQTIAEISKNNSEENIAEVFVSPYDINKINIDDSVNIALDGVNLQKYGTLKGTVIEISQGTTVIETQNGNNVFYKCLINLEDEYLISKDNERIDIVKSQSVEARIVYDKETYAEWFLKSLNFK